MPAKLAPFLLLALALTACGAARTEPSAHADPNALRLATPVAYKTQLVDTHGIELAVPAAWKLNQEQCGQPTANTVLWSFGALTLCAMRERPGLSVVEFGGWLSHKLAWYPRHATPLAIAGVTGWVSGGERGSHRAEVVFPRRNMNVIVYSPRASLVHQILASLQIIQANKDGCPSGAPSSGHRLGSRPSAERFVPVGAIRLAGCSYDGHWLNYSSRVGSRAARQVARALSKAPYGFSRAPGGTIARSECAPSWGTFSVAYFEYAHRPPVAVTAHLDGCAHLGASNGKWGVQMSKRWVDTFTSNVAWDGSFADVWARLAPNCRCRP